MSVTSTDLTYLASIGAALFPCAFGTKRPVVKWKAESTFDTAAWAAWRAAGRNLAIDCAKSGLIVIDVDSSKVTPDQAWTAFHNLALSWGLPAAPAPMTQSARSGWHVPFRRPPSILAEDLGGGSSLVKVSDVRPLEPGEKDGEVVGFKNRGYCVAPGSYLTTPEGDRPYLLMPDAPAPHECPRGLIEAIYLPKAVVQPGSATGVSDPTDVAELVAILDTHGEFSTEPEWFKYMGAIKLALGDTEAGVMVARQMTVDDATEEAFASRWNRLAAVDPGGRMCRIGTMIHRYRQLTGQDFKVRAKRKTCAEIFGDVAAVAAAAISNPAATVAALAANAGATVSKETQNAMDSVATVAELGQPILDDFLASTDDIRPMAAEYPKLPADISNHPLYNQLQQAIDRIIAASEGAFRYGPFAGVFAVLSRVHPTVCEQVVARVRANDGLIPRGTLDSDIKNFEIKVARAWNTASGFITDSKGQPAKDNSDNVAVFARQAKINLRYNEWIDQIEMRPTPTAPWVQLTDRAFGRLIVEANNSQFNYHPAEGLFRRGIEAIADENQYDPLLERLNSLQAKWDGVSRIDTWVSQVCHTPNDAYHRAVGRNILGGMVRRARSPGCVQAETAIFISPKQGTGKSTLCRILALEPAWHTDSFKFEGSPQNIIPQLFGKWVIELSELAGMARKDAEHIKNFMTATVDTFTKKYAAYATDHPRRCLFIGTSNDRTPLADFSGGRRFLPVNVQGEVDTVWLQQHVEQLIGEAAALEAAGADFSIPREIWDVAGQHQDAARMRTPVEELCQEWFDRDHAQGLFIVATDIGRALKMAGQSQHSRYSAYLDKLGWRAENLMIPGRGKGRVWVKATGNDLRGCLRLEPSQMQINGPVEMRLRSTGLMPTPGS